VLQAPEIPKVLRVEILEIVEGVLLAEQFIEEREAKLGLDQNGF